MTKKNRLLFFTLSSISGAVFCIFSYFVNTDIFRRIDYSSMVFLQKVIPRNADVPFSILTILGSTEITVLLASLMFAGFIIINRHIFLGLILFLMIFIFELTGKLLIYHPKPPQLFNRYALDIFLPSSFIVHTEFSYPSGHVARTSFIAVIFLFFILWNRKFTYKNQIPAFLSVILMSIIIISRIYLGEHWLSDVLGGLFLGTAVGSLSLAFW